MEVRHKVNHFSNKEIDVKSKSLHMALDKRANCLQGFEIFVASAALQS